MFQHARRRIDREDVAGHRLPDWKPQIRDAGIEMRLRTAAPRDEIILRTGTAGLIFDANREIIWHEAMRVLCARTVFSETRTGVFTKLQESFQDRDGKDSTLQAMVGEHLSKEYGRYDLKRKDDLGSYIRERLTRLERASRVYEEAPDLSRLIKSITYDLRDYLHSELLPGDGVSLHRALNSARRIISQGIRSQCRYEPSYGLVESWAHLVTGVVEHPSMRGDR